MDLLVQTSAQTHCHRIVYYFEQRQHLHVFPSGPFADSAQELGPLRSHTGPCLVQFSNMQLSPEQFNSWLAGSFVERSCCRLYWLERAISAHKDKQALLQAIVAAALPPGLTAVRLDVYPKAIEQQLGDELEAAGYSGPMHPSSYSHVLFVVQLPDTGLWRWSYMSRQHLWRHSCDKPARFSKSVATAINKIAEAMHVLGLHPQHAGDGHNHSSCLNGLQQQPAAVAAAAAGAHALQQQQHPQGSSLLVPPPAAHAQQVCCYSTAAPPPAAASTGGNQDEPVRWAIDVGACPGGWTSYLADHCGYSVIAIDPAGLHPDVTARPGVHLIKAKAADALTQMDELLQGEQADLLVCDANDHITQLPKFLGPVLPRLKSGGWLVLTLKFYGRGSKDDVPEKLAALLPELEPGKGLWLLANTLCERTYVARKR